MLTAVDGHRERIAFRSAQYWDVEGVFDPGAFAARLVAVDGAKVATGRDFGQDGSLKNSDVAVLDEASVMSLVEGLSGAMFTVRGVDDKPYVRAALVAARSAGARPATLVTTGVSNGGGMAVEVADRAVRDMACASAATGTAMTAAARIRARRMDGLRK